MPAHRYGYSGRNKGLEKLTNTGQKTRWIGQNWHNANTTNEFTQMLASFDSKLADDPVQYYR
jgi:hypothetical protein